MADFDGDASAPDANSNPTGLPPVVVNGGLLDWRTFPSNMGGLALPLTDIDAAAAAGPPQDPYALPPIVDPEVAQDVDQAKAAISPADQVAIARQAALITGPILTSLDTTPLQNWANSLAGFPPVKPQPETWSVNGQLYHAISAKTFDPSRSTGVTSMPTPEDSAAAVSGMSQVAVPVGTSERGGYIAHSPSRVVVAVNAQAGGNDRVDTLKYDRPSESPPIHGHIDSRPRDPFDPLVQSQPSEGFVDDTTQFKGYGDADSLRKSPPVPTATVSRGQVGWHVLDNGQLKFLYPAGSMTPFQIQQMQRNIDQEQQKFLRP